MEWHLVEQILCLSHAGYWQEARLEWDIANTWWEEEPGRCICTHFPIHEHCLLRNRLNGSTTIVGNCCVKKFVPGASALFDGLDRIAKDSGRALNTEGVLYARRQGWVNDWEEEFLFKTCRKRKLTERQEFRRVEINQRILARISERRTHD